MIRQPRSLSGVAWLGAAAARTASLALDRPHTDAAFWSYLAAEIGFGVTAILTAAELIAAEAT